MSHIAALVPMRHHSERVVGKNFRLLGDVPLYYHIVRSLLACASIDEIVIDTDSPVIMEDCTRQFPQVRLLERPAHLCDGSIPMNAVLLNSVQQVQADFYLQTHSTNPLLLPATIREALQRFEANYPVYDSLFGVTRVQTRLWDQLARAINHNSDILLRTQDLPPIYEENSNMYLFTRETLELRQNRIGARPILFEIDRFEAWDIDDEISFKIAEILYRERQGNEGRVV